MQIGFSLPLDMAKLRSYLSPIEKNSVFVAEVQSFLEREGWKVERPSSNDAFEFDLAIRRDGAFAIAINCDSPLHADLRFARHREIWRTRGTSL